MIQTPGVKKGCLRNEDSPSVYSGQGKGGLAALAHSRGLYALKGSGIAGQNPEKINREPGA
jgi:hypothetical protein